MKRFFLSILTVFAVLLSSACSAEEKPHHITQNADIPDNYSTVLSGVGSLPLQRSWDEWQDRVADLSMVVLKVKKTASSTYYWNDGDNVGGITDTTVVLEKVLLGYIDKFANVSVGKEFHLTELFTVDEGGNTVVPKYTLKTTDRESGEETSFPVSHDGSIAPFMNVGEEYIICLWEGWLMSDYGEKYRLECTVDGVSSDVPSEYYSSGYLCYELFECSEAAYLRSSAIVNGYTEKGESREANSYNFYHAMVKEGYERFFVK